jgi:hypothetical protein
MVMLNILALLYHIFCGAADRKILVKIFEIAAHLKAKIAVLNEFVGCQKCMAVTRRAMAFIFKELMADG